MRMLTRIALGLALASQFLGSAQALEGSPVATTPDPECARPGDVIERVQRRYDALADLRADFEQATESAVLGSGSLAAGELTRGTVLLAKPGKMRWSYRGSEPSFVISDGETLWIYDVNSAQASKLSVDEGYLAGAALQFLLGDGRISESFRVSMIACGASSAEFELLPRAAANYESLRLTAGLDSGLITATTLLDLFGNRTTIRFSGIRVDESPDPKSFVFVPPADVEIIPLGSRP